MIIENWLKVFQVIESNRGLKMIVQLTLVSGRVMNADSQFNCFDITELMKLFDVKSSED